MPTIDIIDGVNWVFLKVEGHTDPSLLQRLRDQLAGCGYVAEPHAIDANTVKVLDDGVCRTQLRHDTTQVLSANLSH